MTDAHVHLPNLLLPGFLIVLHHFDPGFDELAKFLQGLGCCLGVLQELQVCA